LIIGSYLYAEKMSGNLLLHKKITKFTKYDIFSPRARSPDEKMASRGEPSPLCGSVEYTMLHILVNFIRSAGL
jgi:hypothetical protein